MDIKQAILSLLMLKNKDYLTVNQIRDGLSLEIIRQLGLRKRVSTPTEVLRHLRPCFGEELKEYKGVRSIYIGYSYPLEDLVLRKIKKTPGLSSKRLRNSLPVVNQDYIRAINSLIQSQRVSILLDEKTHAPKSIVVSFANDLESKLSGNIDVEIEEFKKAYNGVGEGKSFVKIHKIREHFNWPVEKFDRVLIELRRRFLVQLHGGDPSTMSQMEIDNSFTDEKGNLRIIVTWVQK
ncbi:hypothetical protein KKA14_13740 [bacterium]|nr:hypothetical protein [bacterium]